MNLISALAHNDAIYKNIELQLNDLINHMQSNNGKLWIQLKDDKEKFFMLDGEISIGSYCFYKGEEHD